VFKREQVVCENNLHHSLNGDCKGEDISHILTRIVSFINSVHR